MILIITPDIFGPIKGGGIGTAFYNLSIFLAKKGFKVDILYTLGDYRETKESIEYWIDFYRNYGVEFIPLRDKKFEMVRSYVYRDSAYKVYMWLKENREKYKIIIFPEWQGTLYYTLLVKKIDLEFQDKVFVVNVHSPEMWAYLGNFKLPDYVDLIERDYMERKCIEWADILVSPSKYMINWLKLNNYSLPEKIYVIPNIFFKTKRKIEDKKFVSTNKEINELIFFGRLEFRKGLKLFIDTLYRLETFNLNLNRIKKITFLGKALIGTFDSVRYIKERMKDLQSRVNFEVEIITDKNREEALEFLERRRENALVVIPALAENLPYVVYECLELGIRFGVSRVGGIPEMIAEDFIKEITFEPNPSGLLEFLKRALERGVPLPEPSKFLLDGEKNWLSLIYEIGKNMVNLTRNSSSKNIYINSGIKPKVTICLVHYERPNLIDKAVKSIFNQTYKNIEVVLIDDGSKSLEALEKLNNLEKEIFNEKGWKIIRQPNKYLGAARNTGIKQATGDYIFFLDDDNILLPYSIERFMEVILRTQADIVTSALWYGEDLEKEEGLKIWPFLGDDLGSGVFRNVFGDANALWRKEVLVKLGGFSEFYGIGHEDWEIYAKAVLSGFKLIYIPEPLVLYRVSESGMLRRGDIWLNHTRSYEPYYRLNPSGLGTALGYALTLHLARLVEETPQRVEKTSLINLLSKVQSLINELKRKPELIRKFFIYSKTRGLKYTLKQAYDYLKRL